VPDRKAAAKVVVRQRADETNENHIAAPMPGVISTVAVKAGQTVKIGDVLLTIEAMKMETALRASRDATIENILVTPGSQIDAKDLLVVLA
jgi:pyruvate carboxylase